MCAFFILSENQHIMEKPKKRRGIEEFEENEELKKLEENE